MKRLLAIVVCITVLFSLGTPAFAAAIDNSRVFQDPVVREEVYIDPELVGTKMPGDIMVIDDYNEIPVVKETIVTEETVYVTPAGQPSLGYEGGSGATVFFFSSGGSSVKFTVTIATQNVTFKAETGKSTSSGQGYAAPVPSARGRYRFDFIKYYVITTKLVDVYQYGIYKYSYKVHDPQYSLSHRWVRL